MATHSSSGEGKTTIPSPASTSTPPVQIDDGFVTFYFGGKPTVVTRKQLSASKAWSDCYDNVGQLKDTWMCVVKPEDNSTASTKQLVDMANADDRAPMSVVHDFVNFLITCEGVELKHLPRTGTPLMSKDIIAEIKRVGGVMAAEKVDKFLTNLSAGDRDYRSMMNLMTMSTNLGCPTLMVILCIYTAGMIKGIQLESIKPMFAEWEKQSKNPDTYPGKDAQGKQKPASIGVYHAMTLNAARQMTAL